VFENVKTEPLVMGIQRFAENHRWKRIVHGFLVATVWLAANEISVGDIVITQRNSSVRNRGFAGSGGASESSDVQDGTTALSGNLSFSNSFSVQVLSSYPASNGSAWATGSLFTFENVLQNSPDEFSIEASRTSSGTTLYGSGTGNATSRQDQDIRVRFSVSGDPVKYSLQGTFDPGATDGELGSISLYRPFTATTYFDYGTAQTLNTSGILLPGLTYEFRARVIDSMSSSQNGSTSESDASGFNFNFSVSSVPEPSLTLPLLLGSLCLMRRNRTRRSR
jgi:hypothetical protein